MAKVIRTMIDEKGNVSTDYCGFVGDECISDEERLRRDLAELGLILRVTSQERKPHAHPVGGGEGLALRARSVPV